MRIAFKDWPLLQRVLFCFCVLIPILTNIVIYFPKPLLHLPDDCKVAFSMIEIFLFALLYPLSLIISVFYTVRYRQEIASGKWLVLVMQFIGFVAGAGWGLLFIIYLAVTGIELSI